MGNEVFISYAVGDRTIAETVCQNLEDAGYSCWIAPRDIQPGQRFAEAIVQAIDGARVTVLVLSRNSNDSVYVHNEIATSFEKGVPIIPFRIEDILPSVNLELYLGPVQWLDALTLPVEQHVDKLIEALDQFVPRPEPLAPVGPVGTSEPQKALSRSAMQVPQRNRFLQQYRRIGERDPENSDSPWRLIPQAAAAAIEHLSKLHRLKVAALTVFVLCAIGILYVAHLNPFAPRQTSKIGVSIREDENGMSAIRALELYREKFGRMHSNHGIQLVSGTHEDHGDNKMLGVIGKLTSDYADLECPEYDRLRLVYISPGASNPDVTSGRKYVFSMNFNDKIQATMMANFLRYVQKCASVAVVYEETTYSTGLRSGFSQGLFGSYYPVLMVDRKNFPTGFVRERLRPLWENQTPVDAIVLLINSQEGASLTKELREQGFKKVIMCPESCFKQRFIDNVGDDHSNLYVATPFVEGFGTKKAWAFRDQFYKEWGKEPSLWSLFAYEAIDLLIQTYLKDPKVQDSRAVSERIRKSFEEMRTIDAAKVSLSGPLLFEESRFLRRPVIITRIDDGKFKPVSTQIQDCFAADRRNDGEIIAKMTDRGEAVPIQQGSGGETSYLLKTPVVYTRAQVNRLSDFDAGHKSVKIDYEISTKWPEGYDRQSGCAGAVNLVAPKVMKVSGDVDPSRRVKTVPTLSNLADKVDPRMYWKGEAIVPWEPDLRRFPLDAQALQLLVGFSGEDPLDVILAVDGQDGRNETVPEVVGQFDVVGCPTCSDRTYLYVQERPSLASPWTKESLNKKYVSVYELQFILKRKPIYFTILLLPLVISALACLVLLIKDRHPSFTLVIPGISMIGLGTVYGFVVLPYKVPLLSIVNGCFFGAGLMVMAALSRSWTEMITPWLRRFTLVLLASYVLVIAVFWIHWMMPYTLCQ